MKADIAQIKKILDGKSVDGVEIYGTDVHCQCSDGETVTISFEGELDFEIMQYLYEKRHGRKSRLTPQSLLDFVMSDQPSRGQTKRADNFIIDGVIIDAETAFKLRAAIVEVRDKALDYNKFGMASELSHAIALFSKMGERILGEPFKDLMKNQRKENFVWPDLPVAVLDDAYRARLLEMSDADRAKWLAGDWPLPTKAQERQMTQSIKASTL